MKRSALRGLLVIALTVVGATVANAGPADGYGGRTTRVNVSSTGEQSVGSAYRFSISGNGRYVAFASDAADLVAGDTNGVADVFVRDRIAGTTRRISTSTAGAQADGGSFHSSMSTDGRYVLFLSSATDLVPGDTNQNTDIFVRDQQTGTVRRLQPAAAGGQVDESISEATISGDGRYVAFTTNSALTPADTNATEDVYVYESATGITTLASVRSASQTPGSDGSYWGSISATGRYVAFASWADDIVPGDTNGVLDLFLRDRVAGTTVRVSLSDDDQQAIARCNEPVVSADGRYVAFWSEAGLVAGDTNPQADVFVRDVRRGTTTMVSVTPTGTPGNDTSASPSMTPDGRYIAFGSGATNLVSPDTNNWYDIFLRDMRTGQTTMVSVSTSGKQGTWGGDNGLVSADGRHVAFNSSSAELVPADTNNARDLFVRDR